LRTFTTDEQRGGIILAVSIAHGEKQVALPDPVIELSNRARVGYLLAGIFIVVGLFLIQRIDYLLFHNIVELLSILVAFSVFLFAWSSRRYLESDFFVFLGIALLFVAVVDFIHMLAYYGMGVFPGYDKDLPTQLWIIGRYIKAVSLLVAPFFFTLKMKKEIVFPAYIVLVVVMLGLAFIRIFPACYVEGTGLTTFKIVSEYIVCLIYSLAAYTMYLKRLFFSRRVYLLLQAFLAASILSELSFTLYSDVYGFFNMFGHFLKILAFFCLFRGIVHVGFYQPYSLMFLELKSREEATQKEVKTLRGIIPICSSCKKIRDDQGAWNQVEVYVREHSEAEFSHGICPDCFHRLYPGIKMVSEDQT